MLRGRLRRDDLDGAKTLQIEGVIAAYPAGQMPGGARVALWRTRTIQKKEE